MNITWDTPIDELEHSENEYVEFTGDMTMNELTHSMGYSYVDLDEDEIFHWKYVKREKVNGKWRYWYKDTIDGLKDGVKSFGDKIEGATNYAKQQVKATRTIKMYGEKYKIKDGKSWLSKKRLSRYDP